MHPETIKTNQLIFNDLTNNNGRNGAFIQILNEEKKKKLYTN